VVFGIGFGFVLVGCWTLDVGRPHPSCPILKRLFFVLRIQLCSERTLLELATAAALWKIVATMSEGEWVLPWGLLFFATLIRGIHGSAQQSAVCTWEFSADNPLGVHGPISFTKLDWNTSAYGDATESTSFASDPHTGGQLMMVWSVPPQARLLPPSVSISLLDVSALGKSSRQSSRPHITNVVETVLPANQAATAIGWLSNAAGAPTDLALDVLTQAPGDGAASRVPATVSCSVTSSLKSQVPDSRSVCQFFLLPVSDHVDPSVDSAPQVSEAAAVNSILELSCASMASNSAQQAQDIYLRHELCRSLMVNRQNDKVCVASRTSFTILEFHQFPGTGVSMFR